MKLLLDFAGEHPWMTILFTISGLVGMEITVTSIKDVWEASRARKHELALLRSDREDEA